MATLHMCLLHGDFHLMRAECWTTAVGWHAQRPDLAEEPARARYQAAVEQRLLDRLLPTLEVTT